MVEYTSKSITIKHIELFIEFTPDEFFIKPYIWKIWPPMNREFGEYFGHTWAVQFNWLWFIIGINNKWYLEDQIKEK